MGPGPEGPMGSMGPEMGPPVMNGMSSAGNMKFFLSVINSITISCKIIHYQSVSNLLLMLDILITLITYGSYESCMKY